MIKLATSNERAQRRILLVTGLSGAGKSSILRILEDMEFEVVDNAPLPMLESIIASSKRSMAIGVDARTSGFQAEMVVTLIQHLRMHSGLNVELIYATAEEAVLLRRFTATRRRHPLSAQGSVQEGIDAEKKLLLPLRKEAEVIIDTSDLPPPELRQLVESRYGYWQVNARDGLSVTFMSFAFPAGLPREADMVFDARFLKNPYYDSSLSQKTGLDADVVAYVKNDPDYDVFIEKIKSLLNLVLPRFVQEGKKYATIAVGCSGGRHRSVTIIEHLAQDMAREKHDHENWHINIMHRELARQGKSGWRKISKTHSNSST